MGNFNVTNRSLTSQAEYTDPTNGLIINVNYNEDAQSGTLKSITGSVRTNENVHIGSFNGQSNNGEIEYNISAKRKDMAAIVAALAEIEAQIATQGE